MKFLKILFIILSFILFLGCSSKEVNAETKVPNNCKYEKITAKIIVKQKGTQKVSFLIIDKKYFSDNKEQRYVFGIVEDLKDKKLQTQHKVGLDLLVSGDCDILDVRSIKLISSY